VADRIESSVDTIRRTARRHGSMFAIADGVVSLVERRS